jgi:hypothetical protein
MFESREHRVVNNIFLFQDIKFILITWFSAYQAWKLFKENSSVELAAESFVITCNLSEVLRSIHVGLLCVQEDPEDRPNMSNVVLMLGNEDELPHPRQPGFFFERDLIEAAYSSSPSKPCSANECSISELEQR